MKKTPTIFMRDPNNMRLVLDEPNPVAAWVFDNEGVATRKYDGTACLVKDKRLYKRYELRPGKIAPMGFNPAQDPDPHTGKCPGWVPVGDGPEDKWHREAFVKGSFSDGVYELVGPKVQGNKDKQIQHVLIPIEKLPVLDGVPRDWVGLRQFLDHHCEMEGIVWHHPDGRWAKIKRRDFGLKW